ncbi:DegT/DnrJ/EryC1/StrS family aminotransferase [Calidifontibacter indicus]|uniref:DegT/DnrJ/EryC1/StrS family aminotransferase n=1 Tax=Calidifontibacter indicus TaxID=419650 RepID=UPI003D72FBE3
MTTATSTTVPFLDLVAQHAEVAEAVNADLAQVFATAGFVGGPHVAAFEQAYARFCGVDHCVGVGNGTDAVELALRALGVGQGDEVITAANTFVATVEAIVRAGATPVLVDVDDETLLIDPQAVAAAITPRTAAIVPVHLYGQIAPVEQIAAAAPGIAIVEDAAQSQGATRFGAVSGSLGTLAATSFYPGKNLGAAGDAGAVTTNDAELARRVRMLGNHGSERKYEHDVFGVNSRLDAIQSIVLRHKLARLSDWNGARRDAAALYAGLLGDVDEVRLPVVADGNEHVWHLYVIRVDERDRVLEGLQQTGIGAALHYPRPVHLSAAFAGLGYGPGAFPVTERAADQILSLPMYPHLNAGQQERVREALAATVG